MKKETVYETIKTFVNYIRTKYILIYFNKIKTMHIHNMKTRK